MSKVDIMPDLKRTQLNEIVSSIRSFYKDRPMDLGHWEYTGTVTKGQYFGFAYFISNNLDKKFYVGRRQMFHTPDNPKSSNYGKENKWRRYVGSSKDLQTDIKTLGKEHFSFIIIDFYKTREGLHYAESYLHEALRVKTKSNDKRQKMFYNKLPSWTVGDTIPDEDITKKTEDFIALFNSKY